MERIGFKGKTFVGVFLAMMAVILGMAAVQFYIWTAPVGVQPLTQSVEISRVWEAGAVHNGHEDLVGLPNITIGSNTAENYKIRILINPPAAGDNWTVLFDDLSIELTVGSVTQKVTLVTNGTAITDPVTLELDGPDGLGYAPGTNLTVSGVIYENTMPVYPNDVTGRIVLRVYAIEA
ncbi:MAG: hypothetical protein QXU01_02490 [Candidatus Hadarchaeales archaeon]